MEIIVIDRIDHTGAWPKRWSTLGIPAANVHAADRAIDHLTRVDQSCLVVIHESAFTDNDRRAAFETSLKASGNGPRFILYVSHPGTAHPRTRDGGTVHVSGVPFPNNRKLTALKPRLSDLSDRLETCCGVRPNEFEPRLLLAWELWEDEPADFLEALWGQCQSYLAATLIQASRQGKGPPLYEFPRAAAWTNRYLDAVESHPNLAQYASRSAELQPESFSAASHWDLGFFVPDASFVRSEWALSSDSLSAVEALIEEIASNARIRHETVLPAFEALDAWVESRKCPPA